VDAAVPVKAAARCSNDSVAKEVEFGYYNLADYDYDY